MWSKSRGSLCGLRVRELSREDRNIRRRPAGHVVWKPFGGRELEPWFSISHCQHFAKKIWFLLINSISLFLLAPSDVFHPHCPVPTIFSKTQQWLLNKPRGLFLVLTLLDFSTTCFVANFFLPILIFSLSTLAFSKVFVFVFFQTSGPRRWEPKEYLRPINFCQTLLPWKVHNPY